MILLVLGLLLFLGIHSVRIVADDSRQAFINKHSKSAWMGLFSLVSVIGLVLIAYGYGQTRLNPTFLWHPPLFTRHLAALLMLIAMVLLVATYIPRNHIKTKLGHPMILSVKVWALAHIIANGRLGDVLLFGAFLVWAIVDFRSARRRDQVTPNAIPAMVADRGQLNDDNSASTGSSGNSASNATMTATVATIIVGITAYIVFALILHRYLIGVPVFS